MNKWMDHNDYTARVVRKGKYAWINHHSSILSSIKISNYIGSKSFKNIFNIRLKRESIHKHILSHFQEANHFFPSESEGRTPIWAEKWIWNRFSFWNYPTSRTYYISHTKSICIGHLLKMFFFSSSRPLLQRSHFSSPLLATNSNGFATNYIHIKSTLNLFVVVFSTYMEMELVVP